jgi:YVTN family beta-propeller protein
LLAIGLVLAAAKLSIRSAATGEAVLPGVAGAPVLGPAPSVTATPAPNRVNLRVRVLDQAGRPVPQAMVEVRDRFNATMGAQETGYTGDAVVSVPPNAGYVVTARKQGYDPGRVEGVEAGRSQFDVPALGTSGPAAPAAPRPPGSLVQVQIAELAVTGSAGRLYVGHSTPRVSLIDGSSNLLLKHSETLGQGRLTQLGLSKDGTRLYSTWSGAGDLLVLNATDLSAERTLKLPSGTVTSMAVHPQDGRIWIATTVSDSTDNGALNEIDPAGPGGPQVVRRIPLSQAAFGLRFRADGNVLFVPQRTAGSIALLDPLAASISGSWRLAQWPTDFTFSPDGASLYVVNLGNERLLELDTAMGQVRRSIDIGPGGVGVVAHPDGKRLLISNQLYGYVQVVDLSSGKVEDLIPVGRGPQGLSLSADGSSLYVANAQSGSISVIDLARRAVKETLATGGSPYSLLLAKNSG